MSSMTEQERQQHISDLRREKDTMQVRLARLKEKLATTTDEREQVWCREEMRELEKDLRATEEQLTVYNPRKQAKRRVEPE
jgi:predicted  nucleic acid-binding Zn-ribbon protein